MSESVSFSYFVCKRQVNVRYSYVVLHSLFISQVGLTQCCSLHICRMIDTYSNCYPKQYLLMALVMWDIAHQVIRIIDEKHVIAEWIAARRHVQGLTLSVSSTEPTAALHLRFGWTHELPGYRPNECIGRKGQEPQMSQRYRAMLPVTDYPPYGVLARYGLFSLRRFSPGTDMSATVQPITMKFCMVLQCISRTGRVFSPFGGGTLKGPQNPFDPQFRSGKSQRYMSIRA